MRAVANPKKGTSQARNEFIWGWAFILPTMLGLIILNIYPIFKTIYESFFKTGDFGKGNIFIGFDNYVKLFHDAEVWQALLNTFKYAIVEVPFSIAIAHRPRSHLPACQAGIRRKPLCCSLQDRPS